MDTENSLIGRSLFKKNSLLLLHDNNAAMGLSHSSNNNNLIDNHRDDLSNNTKIILGKNRNMKRKSSLISNNARRLYLFLALLFGLISFTFGQTAGDYRSNGNGNGNWTDASGWDYFDGSNWVEANTPINYGYPGENPGTNDVTIRNDNSITLNSAIPNNFNSLTVGDGIGSTDGDELIIGSSTGFSADQFSNDNNWRYYNMVK